MDFAIVRFLNEGGAPGIISTNWLLDKNTCKYPNVQTEFTKNKLLISRSPPLDDWITCPIKVLKEFPSYQLAKVMLSDAEDTSTLESCNKEQTRKRKRRQKKICLPGEEFMSEDDEDSDSSPRVFKIKRKLEYPLPQISFHTPTHTPTISPSPTPNSESPKVQSNIPSTFICSTPLPLNSLPISHTIPQHVPPTFPFSYSKQPLSQSSMKINSLTHAALSQGNRQALEIKHLQINQNMMWEMLTGFGEITSKLESLEKKIDSLMSAKSSKESTSVLTDEPLNFLASLPVEDGKFSDLEELLSSNTVFRKELIRILLGIGGKDVKSLTAHLLRKVISDEVAERFTLTGKSRNGTNKESFENTKLYQVIKDVCFRKYKPETTENAESNLRESLSDWLMQAKFRRIRRESRQNKTQ